ncbi:hypothetical protein ES332_A04G092800v1 [Gossypium tomentosum]|uniref:Uncharacterized protein n=1 Tax=Gossypium tomentosum TaxID=34277 RepID=A0A5D2QW65_GOSTO|nr:hypothetical protein ES332_A04G092800v1 [Gossypium tomentosum]
MEVNIVYSCRVETCYDVDELLKSIVSRNRTHVCTCTPTSTSFASLRLGIFATSSNAYVLTYINTVKGIISSQFATF